MGESSGSKSNELKELLHTLVVGQTQLREDIQQIFRHLLSKEPLVTPKGSNIENKVAGTTNSPMTEFEKRMLQRVEQMEKVIKKTCRFDEVMDLQSLSLFPKARLPLKFKMPSLNKFNGMGCPVTHLKMYTRAMHPVGANDEILAQLFHNTLTRLALKWFFNLKDSRTNTWEDICSEFFKQYRFNNEVDVTRRDLETTKQDSKETFLSFIMRWRAKAVQMTARPSEEDQLQMVVKNLLPTYNKHALVCAILPTFKALVAASTQIEDALQTVTKQD